MITALFISIIILFLYAGLRPFNFFPSNQVKADKQGLQFGPRGIAYSKDVVQRADARGLTLSFSLTFLTLPSGSIPRILCLTNDKGDELFSIGQWKKSIIFRAQKRTDFRAPALETSTGSLFEVGQTADIAISSGAEKANIFVNGNLVRQSNELAGLATILQNGFRLVVGNGPMGTQSWKGIVHSIIVYDRESSDGIISRDIHPILSYSLADKEPHLVQNSADLNNPLIIPKAFRGIKREFLVPIWAIERSPSLAADMIINLAGFVPFGIVAFLFFRQSRRHFSSFLLGLTSGIAMSLFIEVLQVFLPGRTSQMTDLLLNSLGTLIGVIAGIAAYKWIFEFRQYPQTYSRPQSSPKASD